MNRMVLFCLMVPGSAIAAEVVWKHFPHSSIDPDSKPLFVDLDQDGRSEILFLGAPRGSLFGLSSIAVLGGGSEPLRLIDLFSLPGQVQGQLTSFDAGDGSTHFMVALPDGIGSSLWQISGQPLKLIRTSHLPVPIRLHHLVDLNDDGQFEVLGTIAWGPQAGRLASFSYPKGELLWMTEGVPFSTAIMKRGSSNLYDVIVSIDELMVLDGATGEERWRHPDGVAGGIGIGRFLEDPTIATFMVTSGQEIKLFRADSFEELSSLVRPADGPVRGSAFDLTGDGVDEIIVDGEFYDQIESYAMPSGDLIAAISAQWSETTFPVAGRVAKNEEPALIYGSYLHHSSIPTEGVRVVGFDSGEIRYSANTEIGPFWLTGFGDISESGEQGMILLDGQKQEQYPHAWRLSVKVFDLDGGLLRARVGYGANWEDDPSPVRPMLMNLANVDGNGGDDIIFANVSWSGSYFGVIDGESLDMRWHHAPTLGAPLYDVVPMAAASADFDGDGLPDAVFVVRKGGIHKLLVLSGLDGSLILESTGLGFINSSAPTPDIVVATFDEGGPERVVMTTGVAAMIIDPASPDSVFHFGPASPGFIHSIRVWGSGEDCRIGLLLDQQRLETRACHDVSSREEIQLPEQTQFFLPIDDRGDRFIVTREGTVGVVGRDGAETGNSGYWGNDLQGVAANAIRRSTDSSGGVDLLLGSRTQVVAFRVEPDEVFANGFETDVLQ